MSDTAPLEERLADALARDCQTELDEADVAHVIQAVLPVLRDYDRQVLVDVLVYHWRKGIEGCGCGWAELGKSWPEHVANVYEERCRRD